MQRNIYLITGVMAAGKSTVAERLARRLDHCVHLRGDSFRRMIVSGREDMTENASEEAVHQLYLRYRITAMAAKEYLDAGFDVAVQDNYYGNALTDMMDLLEGSPVRAIVLCPDVETVKQREAERGKIGYSGFDAEALYADFMATTPRIGYWIDTTRQTPNETVDAIFEHFKVIGI